jgi:hypothetical protein
MTHFEITFYYLIHNCVKIINNTDATKLSRHGSVYGPVHETEATFCRKLLWKQNTRFPLYPTMFIIASNTTHPSLLISCIASHTPHYSLTISNLRPLTDHNVLIYEVLGTFNVNFSKGPEHCIHSPIQPWGSVNNCVMIGMTTYAR